MSKFKIKESYLLLLIVLGLVSLGVYTTYALFTASTTINDVVGITATLDINKSLTEYEIVVVEPNETKLIELNVVNSYNDSVYYGAWYQIASGNSDDIQIGLYTEKNNNPSSGALRANSSVTLLAGIKNNSNSKIIVYIGVKGSLEQDLKLGNNRKILPNNFSPILLVTPEELEKHKTTDGDVFNKTYSCTNAKVEETLPADTYVLQVWGAQGGNYNTTYIGGKGGYSEGTLTLSASTKVYVYVGCQGSTYNSTTGGTSAGGFNGGGSAVTVSYSGTTSYVTGGGGATDIRIGEDSLYARVIVAGGGSGSSNNNSGYYGGGTSAGYGTAGYGATTTSAGTNGSFGTGASANPSSTNYKYASPGGGGGWYGGGSSGTNRSDSTNYRTYTGGGSGYVYTSSTASNYPTGNKLNSSYYLTDATTYAGNSSFSSITAGKETGHSGNGYAKIANLVKYNIPVVNGLTDLEVNIGKDTYDLLAGVSVTCGSTGISCTLNGPEITDLSTLPIGDNTIYYIVEESNGNKYKYPRKVTISKSWEYTSSGTRQLTLGRGEYKLEVYGASGETASRISGGKGGYSVGTLALSESTNIYVHVGNVGASKGYYDRYSDGDENEKGAGGGSSDIRIQQDSLYARVIVAGGGEGGLYQKNYSSYPGAYARGYDNRGYSFGNGEANYGCGGGWYGGSHASGLTYTGQSAGSGYAYSESTASAYPSGCLLNSSYYLIDSAVYSGDTSTWPSTRTKVSSTSNGVVVITQTRAYIDSEKPIIYGLDETTINRGGNYNAELMAGVTIACATGDTSCSIEGTDIEDIFAMPLGKNTINYIAKDGTGNTYEYSRIINIYEEDYYTTSGTYTFDLRKGTYKLEVYGASGETVSGISGGNGGYSIGTLTLNEITDIYIHVGNVGASKGYYDRYSDGDENEKGAGGGSSDIRIQQDSLYARVIVAGGGEGGLYQKNYSSYPGAYARGYDNRGYSFGNGEANYGCGGGWYGGSHASGLTYTGQSAGSGYAYSESTASAYPSGCLLNSSYYLIDSAVYSGDTSTWPSTRTKVSSTSNGAVIITKLSD